MYRAIERFLYSPAYAILFSLYPFLHLYANNLGQVGHETVLGLVLLALAIGAGIFAILWRVYKNKESAGAITSLLLVAIFYYGHVVHGMQSAGLRIPAALSALAWIGLSAALVSGVSRLKPLEIRRNVPAFNLMVIVLLLFPVMKIGRYAVTNTMTFTPKTDHARALNTSARPDIYYIILDSYGRSDTLQREYGYDNSEFIQSLEEMGFYVAGCSQSNYHITMLSLGSSLNMDYLQKLSDEFQPGKTDSFYLFKALDNNAVRRSLEASGYQTIAFATGFPWTELSNTDRFFAPEYASPIDEFSILAIKTTFFRIFDDFGLIDLDTLRAERYRARTRLALSSFQELAALPGPKFVFMHLILPHPPYVFDAQGNPTRPDATSDQQGYPAQVAFASAEILKGLETLLKDSPTPPIIILQGDHGPFEAEVPGKLQILNAYYFPGRSKDIFYAQISPVNTFRMIFNQYFGQNYPLLEDRSFVSDLADGFNFRPVPNTCPEK